MTADATHATPLVEGGLIMVPRTHGIDARRPPAEQTIDDQAALALRRVARSLALVGARLEDVVQARCLVPVNAGATALHGCTPRLKRAFGRLSTVATPVAAGLLAAGVAIEIEVRARLG